MLHAQGDGGNATIEGRVSDNTGAAVRAATITLTNTATGATRTIQSDSSGYFAAPSLQVGTYTVTASSTTFAQSSIENVTLSVGDSLTLAFKLQPTGVSTTVEVSAVPDLTHRDEVQNASLIENTFVEDLPTRGRNFTDFALLTPGVSQELDRFGLVVNGQRSSNLNISIDGADFNDPLQGGQRGGNDSVYFFPQVAVQEFQVARTGVPASVGRTNAGFVNVVTKSGTNRFHGEALYTNRNPTFTWADPFNDPNSNNIQNQFAFAIGGPIQRDKLFFFAGVEKNLLQTPFTVYFQTPAGFCDPSITAASSTITTQIPCTAALLAGGTKPLPAAVTAQEVSSFGVNNPLASSGRLDYHLNDRNTLTFTYTSTFLSGLAFGSTAQQTTAISDNTNLARQSQGGIAGITTVFGSTKTNDFRLQYAYDNRQQVPISSAAEIDIGDLGTLGGAAGGTYIYRAIREEALDNFTWLLGRHTLSLGFDLNLEPETQQREANANGLWTIGTFAEYIAAMPVAQGGSGLAVTAANGFQFQQTLPANGGPELSYKGTQREYAGYLQDSFRITPRLTLNAGFRYEAELEPQPASANPALPQTGIIVSDLTQYQPRLGLAWDPYGTGKTVIRVSSGLYDAHTPAYILARNFTDNGITNDTLNTVYDPSLFGKVPYLGQLTAPPASNIINDVYTNTLNFKNPRSVQASAAVEQQLAKDTVVVLSYVQNETYDLQHRLNTNLFQPVVNALTFYPVFPKINPLTGVACTAFGVAVPCRPNNSIGAYNQNYSSAHSTYRALQVAVRTRITRRVSGHINYTWASARDDDSNERDFNRQLALDPLCTACYNKGYSKQDIRHQANISAVTRLPLRFTFSTSLVLRTALPYNATLSGGSADTNNDGNTNNDRPILCSQIRFTVCPFVNGLPTGFTTGRDTFRQPGFLNWDMRLYKTFRIHELQQLQVSAEGLNVSRASNLNFGANEESKFGKLQTTLNPVTGYYYSNAAAGFPTGSPATNRSGGPRQIQLGARYVF